MRTMRRRDVLALPLLAAASGCSSKIALADSPKPVKNDLVEKAKIAMLTMQRASWEQGVASQAMIEAGEKDIVVLMAKEAVLRSKADGRVAMLGSDSAITDPGSNGQALLYAYKATNDKKFKDAADALYTYLKKRAPSTENGAICHITAGREIWSDSMFMAPPFLAAYGDFDEAIRQVDCYRGFLWNKDKKLFSHIWDDKKKAFKRDAFWGGGNGWSAAGMAQIIDTLPKDRQDDRKKLIGYVEELLDGCISFMRPDGLFHDVVDDANTFVETNLSQMLAYAIYKGVKSGWLKDSYLKSADKMRAAANSKVDEFGVVQGACSSPLFDRSGTSTEAQAFFLMMEEAHARLAP
jgi:unsaturated rhamnogalacturonyl hydrolase